MIGKILVLGTLFCAVCVAPQLHAQSTSSAESAAMEDLFDAIKRARREELFVIDEVSESCNRITSGLKQRNSLFFLTTKNNQSSELRIDGSGMLKFDPGSEVASECNITNQVDFKINEVGATTWIGTFTSQYCISAIVYSDCSHVCRGSIQTEGKYLKFILGSENAERQISMINSEKTCQQ